MFRKKEAGLFNGPTVWQTAQGHKTLLFMNIIVLVVGLSILVMGCVAHSGSLGMLAGSGVSTGFVLIGLMMFSVAALGIEVSYCRNVIICSPACSALYSTNEFAFARCTFVSFDSSVFSFFSVCLFYCASLT